MSSHDDVGETLRQQAAQIAVSERPISLDDVKGRARGIRRRRAAVGGLAVAAVLVIAAPLALSVWDGPSSTPDVASSGEDRRESGVTPQGTVETRLTSDTESRSAAPGLDYVIGDKLHTGDGRVLDAMTADWGEVAAITRVDEGWITMTYGIDSALFNWLAEDGSVRQTWDSYGEDPPVWMERIRMTQNGAVLTPLPPGTTYPTADLSPPNVGGLAPDGGYSSVVSADDSGSCSAVFAADGSRRWKTCGYTLGAFSPDGRYVEGRPPYLDGAGDGLVAILDAQTGAVLAEFRPDQADAERGVWVVGSTWDTDGTLLSPLWDQDHWSLVRLGSDGSLSLTEGPPLPGKTGDNGSPVALAAVS